MYRSNTGYYSPFFRPPKVESEPYLTTKEVIISLASHFILIFANFTDWTRSSRLIFLRHTHYPSQGMGFLGEEDYSSCAVSSITLSGRYCLYIVIRFFLVYYFSRIVHCYHCVFIAVEKLVSYFLLGHQNNAFLKKS